MGGTSDAPQLPTTTLDYTVAGAIEAPRATGGPGANPASRHIAVFSLVQGVQNFREIAETKRKSASSKESS